MRVTPAGLRSFCAALVVAATATITISAPSTAGAVAHVTPAVTRYSLNSYGDAQLDAIVAGPDHSMWFAEPGLGEIGRIDDSGTIAQFHLGLTPGTLGTGLAVGPDGNLWFTTTGSSIGRLTPAGVVTLLPTGLAADQTFTGAGGIVAGPDGSMWFATAASVLGRITTSGLVSSIPLAAGLQLDTLITGPDGNVWATNNGTSIYRISPAGVVDSFTAGTGLSGLAVGSDGALWFTDFAASKIGRITTSGTVTTFDPFTGATPGPITLGSDGNVWYAELSGDIGYTAPDGSAFGFALPGSVFRFDLATSASGDIWITSHDDNELIRLAPPAPAAATTTEPSSTSTTSAASSSTTRAPSTTQVAPAAQPVTAEPTFTG